MPKTKISEFDVVAANNTDINGIDIAEGCAPSGINNAIRTLMSDLKDWQAGTSGDTLPIAAGGTGATTAALARTALGATTTGSDLFTSASAAAARTTLGATTTGNSLFTAVDAAAARTAIGAGTGDVTTTGSQVLTNKTISADNNALSGIAASSFVLSNGSGNIDGSAAQKAIPAGVVVGTTDTQVLTNKTIDGASNTLTNLPLANITEPNLPTIRPSLNLDFANTKQLDPRITFTRASTGTFYNGITTAKAEENLFTYSQEFDNAVWVNNASTETANTTTAPDGTTTADSLIEDSNTASHQTATTVSVNGDITFSVFAKLGTGTRFLIIGLDGSATNYASACFNLSTGALTQTLTNTYTVTSTSITASTNGFYRCTMTINTASNLANTARIGLSNTATFTNGGRGMASYTGDGTSSLFIWGAQLEQRSAVSSYTATTTQPITNYIPVLQTAQNNVARFEHNPITGESLGLEIEEQRTNLLTYSDDFANAAWTKFRASITSNTIVAPDGTLTGDKLVSNTDNNSHSVYSASYTATNVTITASAFVKAAEQTYINLQITNFLNHSASVNFDLSTQTVVNATTGSTDYTNVSGQITAVGNGWFRCSITATKGTQNNVNRFWMQSQVNTTSGGGSFVGNDFNGIYIWGAQLEAGAFPTSYIPTVASQVTRSADAAVMTGTNFSSWYRADEGTLSFIGQFISGAATEPSTFRRILALSDGTINNTLQVVAVGTPQILRYERIVGGVFTSLTTPTTPTGVFSYTCAYKVGDYGSSLNGAAALTNSASGLLPVVSVLNIGAQAGGSASMCGTIKKLAYYPARISNQQLQALTGS